MARKINDKSVAVLLGLGAALCLSTQDLFIKLLSEDVHIMQIVFVRSCFAFISAALWVRFFDGGWKQLRITNPRLVAVRIICTIGAWFCYYISLSFLSLPIYTTIGFTVFIFAALLSGPILKEPLSWREWLATLSGMLGVFLIVNPLDEANMVDIYAAMLLLLGAFLWALSIVVTRALGAFMPAGGIMFYSNLGLLIIGSFGAPAVWQAPAPQSWLLLVCVGVLAFMGQNMMITAVQFARVAVVTPTQYTSLLWATLFGWLAWETLPGGAFFIGAALIILGNYFVLRQKKK